MLKFAIVLLVMAAAGAAAPLCPDVVATAADFQAQGHTGCQFGDKVFFDFVYSYTIRDSSGTILPDGDGFTPTVPSSSVTVSFSNAGGNSYSPVISFFGPWLVQTGDTGDLRFDYSVTAPSSASIYEASMGLFGVLSNVDPNNLAAPAIRGG